MTPEEIIERLNRALKEANEAVTNTDHLNILDQAIHDVIEELGGTPVV